MIKIDNATILDLLPHTFLTDECRALAAALQRLYAKYGNIFTNLAFWGDIENAPETVLDAMAAEVDAPFYENDLPIEQKRAIILAAFNRNSQVGTVRSMTELLDGAFGRGVLSEWYEYGGEPYHFKIDITTEYPKSITAQGFELFAENINKFKPKRAKLDAATFSRAVQGEPVYIGIGILNRYKKRIIPAVMPQDEGWGV